MSISAAVAFIPPAIRIISPPFVTRLTSSSSPDKELDMLGDGTDDDAPADVEGEGDNTMAGDGTDDNTMAGDARKKSIAESARRERYCVRVIPCVRYIR